MQTQKHTIGQFSVNNTMRINLNKNGIFDSVPKTKAQARHLGFQKFQKSKDQKDPISRGDKLDISTISGLRISDKQDYKDLSMSERFIKFIPSEESDYLIENHPNAFLLITIIARQARRYSGHIDGLEIGDAIIGETETSKKSGLSKKQYRNALDKLEELGLIETVFNPKDKNIKKRAIKRAIKSKIVNLKNSKIYDINSESIGDQKGEEGANRGRSEGDKQERRKKEIRMNKENKNVLPNAPDSNPTSDNICDVQDSSQTPAALRRVQIYFSLENRKFENITDEDLKIWKTLYPAVDLFHEILRMSEWCLDNESKTKSKKQWRKFITNWLKSENEKAINKMAYQQARKSQKANPEENKTIAINFSKAWTSKNYRIEILNKFVEIGPLNGGSYGIETIQYDENGFSEQLENVLRKKGFIKNA